MKNTSDNDEFLNNIYKTSKEHRLKTFEKWSHPLFSPQQMASNGFYYVGDADKVRCFLCKVEIFKWVQGDDPAKEHRRFSPHCRYMRMITSSELKKSKYRIPVEESLLFSGAVHPNYSSKTARLRSFIELPHDMQLKSENLVEAGLFYTGEEDRMNCFYCGGGLKDWDANDEPWEQHARWFSNCRYVQLIKGQNYIQEVLTRA